MIPRVALGAMAALLLPLGASGQMTRGAISGTVQDSTNGFLDAVTVTVLNLQTGLEREARTNSAGIYRFAALEPGYYSALFSKPGFESKKLPRIPLTANQDLVFNVSLDISAIVTTVEVKETPAGAELAKSTPTMDRTFGATIVERLPLIASRDVNRLMLLAPTAARVTGANSVSVNGQRGRNNNFTIDGVDNNDAHVSTPALRLIPEQIAEFQVQTSAYSAEFGRNSGAQVLAMTKSGSNSYHGEIYNYYAADWMEALTLSQKRTGVTDNPRLIHNEPGAAVGGRLLRDKTFFFSSIDTTRRRGGANPTVAAPVTIPTPQGFAALAGVPLGRNQTTESRQAALSALNFIQEYHPRIAAYDSKTITTVNGVPIEMGTTKLPLYTPVTFWYAANRIDHQLTAKDTLTYRNVFDHIDVQNMAGNTGFGDRWAATSHGLSQTHAISETRVFSARLLNEFRGSYTRKNLHFTEKDPRTATTFVGANFSIGGGAGFPQSRIQNLYQAQDTLTFISGRHSLKMGIDYRHLRVFDFVGAETKGTWRFDNFPAFLNGDPRMVTLFFDTSTSAPRQHLFGGFFQDDFRLARDLTVTLGLRYEYNTMPFGFFGATDPAIRATRVQGPARDDTNNWAPRFGLAYSPHASSGWAGKLFGEGQTVLRGGYGVSYDTIFLNLLANAAGNQPRVRSAQIFQPATLNMFPNLPVSPGPAFTPTSSFSNLAEDAQNPTTHFYSFSIQRRFKGANILELGYSGNRSYHQIRLTDRNYAVLTEAQAQAVASTGDANRAPTAQSRRLDPAAGQRLVYETSAGAYYNAGYVRYDRRLARGLQIGANYTYSTLMSDADEALGIFGVSDLSPAAPQDYRDYRPDWSRSAFDRPHRLALYYSYEPPWFTSGMAARALPRQIFSGWEVSGSSEWQSGQPFTIRTTADSLGNGRADGARPDYNPNGSLLLDPVEGNWRTFKSPLVGGRFVTPLSATTGFPVANSMAFGGNLGRNTFRAPNFTTWNLSLAKTFSINERWKIRIRNDIFNLFNHRNFAPPVITMNSSTFGQNNRDQVGDSMRNMLASIKVIF